jgi:hypothetical protein
MADAFYNIRHVDMWNYDQWVWLGSCFRRAPRTFVQFLFQQNQMYRVNFHRSFCEIWFWPVQSFTMLRVKSMGTRQGVSEHINKEHPNVDSWIDTCEAFTLRAAAHSHPSMGKAAILLVVMAMVMPSLCSIWEKKPWQNYGRRNYLDRK